MPRTIYPRRILPPSDPSPTWQGKASQDLVYLGWGSRNFEREPIAIHYNPGWTYWVLLEGEVDVAFDAGTKHFKSGQGMRCGPDYAFGFPGNKGEVLQVLNWIWKEPPIGESPLPMNDCSYHEFSADQIRLVKVLHEQTRLETLEATEKPGEALHHLRGLLDLVFERASQAAENNNLHRLHNARLWMLNNLHRNNPNIALARFMNISLMTLHRLFSQEVGESPGAYFQRLKMEQSSRLLAQDGYPVKRVAFEMGYKHAQDFSRAYKAYFGHPPTAK